VRRHWILKGAAILVLGTAFVAALTFVVMSLWNALVPSLFAGPVIGFWQAAGILVLSRILFGGFRGRGGHGWRHRGWHGRWGRMTPEERSRVRDGFARWKDMSREERREFRGKLHGRFHGCGSRTSDEIAEPKETQNESQ
jgi:hypothetical protein